MGLDMYIRIDDGVTEEQENEAFAKQRNYYEQVYKPKELAYWRKHPNLHGYIVQTYAAGVDECQRIPLTLENVQEILVASEADRLPETEGFFFGASRPEDKADTKEQLEKVLAWMRQDPTRKIYYRASW